MTLGIGARWRGDASLRVALGPLRVSACERAPAHACEGRKPDAEQRRGCRLRHCERASPLYCVVQTRIRSVMTGHSCLWAPWPTSTPTWCNATPDSR